LREFILRRVFLPSSSLGFPPTDRIESEVTHNSNPFCFNGHKPTGRSVIFARKPLSRKAISNNKPLTSDIIKPFRPIPVIAASPPCVLATSSSQRPTVVQFAPTKRTVELPRSKAGTLSSQDSFEFSDVMEEKGSKNVPSVDIKKTSKEGDDGWTAGCNDMVRMVRPPVSAFHQCDQQTRGIVRTRQTTGSIVVSLRNTYAKSRAWFWIN
jgi:hypothetical protein